MLCKSCGNKLKENHKFCGGCGAKVDSSLTNSIDSSSDSNIVVPLKMGLSTMPIEIGKVKITGPENDNSYLITISSSFKNNGKEDWDFLQIKIHLLNSDGLVLKEETDTVEKLVEVNEAYEHETNMWSLPGLLLGESPEKVSVVVSAVASQKHIHEFQEFPIPSKANEIANIAPPCLIGPALKLLSSSMWRSEPDEDKESAIEINFLFQNLETILLPEVRLIADIVDKKGKTLTETGNSKEIQPGELTQLVDFVRLKETKLAGAKLKFSLQTYYPVSAGIKGKLGGELVSVESNDVAWPFDDHGDDVASSDTQNDDTESTGSIKTFEWSMKLGEINMDDVEDEEVLSALKNSLKLAKAKKFDDAVNALPPINFEYSFSNLDSDASDYFAETESISFGLDPSNSKHTIQVGVSGGKLNLSVTVVFDIPVKDGINLDELNEWLGENGGYAAGFASCGWSYNGDEGGHMRSILTELETPSQLDFVDKITCRYCVDLGRYFFSSKNARDKFFKKPEFIFDFQPTNVDDKNGLVRIFGSTNFEPIFENNLPKFDVTLLEKDDDNDCGIIVSVEIEMSFALRIEVEEFRDWVESSESTWRYSGRIECVGEDGLDTSDREEYEFDWLNESSPKVTMEAVINWGYSNDDIDVENLPTEFIDAKKLWATKKPSNIKKAGELIAPFIACIFIESNCDGDLSELFSQSMDEIEADYVNVYGLDFSESNLPKVKVSARFSGISSNGLLDKKRLDVWQDENGFLDSCISFEWRLEGVDEELDLRSWNHTGLSFLLVV